MGKFSIGNVIFSSKQTDIILKRDFCMVFYLMVNKLNINEKYYTFDTGLVFLAK